MAPSGATWVAWRTDDQTIQVARLTSNGALDGAVATVSLSRHGRGTVTVTFAGSGAVLRTTATRTVAPTKPS